jgi:hypothetical protein
MRVAGAFAGCALATLVEHSFPVTFPLGKSSGKVSLPASWQGKR